LGFGVHSLVEGLGFWVHSLVEGLGFGVHSLFRVSWLSISAPRSSKSGFWLHIFCFGRIQGLRICETCRVWRLILEDMCFAPQDFVTVCISLRNLV